MDPRKNRLEMSMEVIEAARVLNDSTMLVVLTGAGVSKESGIPTFREAQTGLWAQYEPEKLATREGFRSDPNLVWSWYDWRRQLVQGVQPNAGHQAIVDFEQNVSTTAVLTQNVDGLHLRAGSVEVTELHGNIQTFKCFDHNHPAGEIELNLKEPPLCHCGSMIRPAVVWFGEALDVEVLNKAYRMTELADVFLVAGTSGLVQPAASLPFIAKKNGAKIIECNTERTPVTDIADVFLQGPSGVMLPQVFQAYEHGLFLPGRSNSG